MPKKQKFRKENLYYDFIEILKQKQKLGFPEGIILHNHHIEPKHDGGDPNGELVVCTIRNHARAHFIRYLVYGQRFDLAAYFGLASKTDEMQIIIQQQIIETNRQRKNGMFDPKWQTIMANRPKSSYHLQENPDFAKVIGQKGCYIGGLALHLRVLGN